MVWTRFDPDQDLILVKARLWGPRGDAELTLALDTGATMTLISPGWIDDVGYSARQAVGRSSVSSMAGVEHGYRIRIQRLAALGYDGRDLVVGAHDLPDKSGFDGLLGLDFLRRFNYEVRSREGRIRTEQAQ